MAEVDDPLISDAMTKMMAAASPKDLNQTVLDLAALSTALCTVLAESTNVTRREVLDCVLAR